MARKTDPVAEPRPPESAVDQAPAAQVDHRVSDADARALIDSFAKLESDDDKDDLRVGHEFQVIGEVRGWSADRAARLQAEITEMTADEQKTS